MNKSKPNQEENSGKNGVSVIGKPITVNEVNILLHCVNNNNFLYACPRKKIIIILFTRTN